MTDTINDTEVVYRCGYPNHVDGRHLHFRDTEGNITYSEDMNYVSTHSERQPHLWAKGGEYPVRDVTFPALPGDQQPRLVISTPEYTGMTPWKPMLAFADPNRDGQWLVMQAGPGGYELSHRRVSHLPERTREWMGLMMEAMAGRAVSITWVAKHSVRDLGVVGEPHRVITEEGYGYRLIPALVDAQIADLESRVGEALREQKAERSWCSELEDEWLPQMMLDKSFVKGEPEYRTFEVEVTFDVTSTITVSRTVTVPIDGDDESDVRYRAYERAEEEARDDLKYRVDFGQYGYAEGDCEYELSDTDSSSEWDSDQDGEEV